METGISVYFGSSYEENRKIVQKAGSAGVTYAFTSLHIPEETEVNYESDMKRMLALCRENGLSLIADISPVTLEKLNCHSYDELEALGIRYLRLDFGFTAHEVVDLAKTYHVVFNASTITEQDLTDWQEAGADFSRFTACHNFYPKRYTGLSVKRIREINSRLKGLGFTTMAFVAGNKELRGPLGEGLPTAEEHRNDQVFHNMLQLFYETGSDVVLIGDIDVTEDVWERIREFNAGYITLRAELDESCPFVMEGIHHDRPDSSEYVIRSQESRVLKPYRSKIAGTGAMPRRVGDIFISNETYLRYNGELEIARVGLPPDERVNVIGTVAQEDLQYLPYIRDGFGFRLFV